MSDKYITNDIVRNSCFNLMFMSNDQETRLFTTVLTPARMASLFVGIQHDSSGTDDNSDQQV